jgi:predicted MPP superfamily phosphohydrolase
MSLFFLIFFALYGGMHGYAFFRARTAFGFGAAIGSALALFMLVMTVSIFLIRVLERHEYELCARVLSYIAYLWMALLFLYFFSSLSIDLINLLARAAGWVSGKPALLVLNARNSFLAAVGLAFVITVYGYLAALDIRVERLRIETPKLPAGIERLRIVQISDVHLGLVVRCDRLKRIMNIVKTEQPDIFVSTGDLVDAQINHMVGMAELLRSVRAPYGNYAITGNHEFYAGIRQALDFTRQAGFTILRGEAVRDVITIVGVDDPAAVQVGASKLVEERQILAGLPQNRFTLLLKHRPVVDRDSAALFDLQLSGHTHKGQIFPFTYLSRLAYPMNAGRFDLASGAVLRVSRGTGTWGPPVRFLSPPEVTVIDLVRRVN